jgi:hypothetical protein
MEPMNVVSEILEKLQAAWRRADGNGYAASFSEDADTIYKGSSITHKVTDARVVGADVIVAHGTATMETTNGMLDGRRAINTLVLVRSGARWEIAAFHNAMVEKS